MRGPWRMVVEEIVRLKDQEPGSTACSMQAYAPARPTCALTPSLICSLALRPPQVIWNPLRDSRQHVREAAVKALRACLVLVEKRETRYRVQWYYR